MLPPCLRAAVTAVALAVTALAVTTAGSAQAHVTANPDEAPSGSYFRTALRIGHGCDGAATVAVRVKIPDGIISARPQMKPGWQISITMRKLDKPVDAGHGRTVAEVVDQIEWRGGPLPNAYFDEFGLSLKLPAAPAGETVYFPVVQECETGVHRWIEIPSGGRKWGDLDQPAPFVTLTAPKPVH